MFNLKSFYFHVICVMITFGFITTEEARAGYCNSAYLYSQADIDNFNQVYSCDSIEFLNIYADGANVRLDSLYNLTYIGRLFVDSNLEDFDGLQQVTSMNSVVLQDVNMTSLDAFPTISTLSFLRIANGKYADFNGLSSLQHVEIVDLSYLPNLTSLNGLQNLVSSTQIDLSYLPQLSSFSLNNLTSLDNLNIYAGVPIKRIDGLNSLDSLNYFSLRGATMDTLVFDESIPVIEQIVINFTYDSLKYIEFTQLERCRRMSLLQNNALEHVYMDKLDLTDYSNLFLQFLSNNNFKSIVLNEPLDIDRMASLIVQATPNFDFTPFSDLEVCGSLTIANSNLTSWIFDKLKVVGTLTLTENTSLSSCCNLYNQLNDNVILNPIIYGNAFPCSEYFEIVLNCGSPVDGDEDAVLNATDNCPDDANQDQSDIDGDGIGDVCDNCPIISNPGQSDANGNGIGDACENANYNTKLEVINGDAFIDVPSGLILRGQDNNCYRVSVGSGGQINAMPVTCP